MGDISRFARRYMLRYLHWYLAGAVALLVTNWLSVTIPLYVAQAIDALSLVQPDRAVVLRAAVLVAAMGVGVMVVRSLSRILFFTPGRLVEARLKHDLFARLLRQQPAFLGQWPTGDVVSRASSDITMIRLLAGFGALQVFNATVAITLTVGQMVRLSPELALWVVGPVVVGFAVLLFFVRQVFFLVKRLQDELAKLSDLTLTSFQGISTIQGFVAERAFIQRFEEQNDRWRRTAVARANLRAVIGPVMGLATALSVFILLYVGGPMALRGQISVGELVAFTSLVAYLALPMRGTSFLLSVVKQAQAALQRVHEVMEPEPDRPDLPDPRPAPRTPPTLEVRGLDFAYPDEPDRPVLQGVSLTVPAGTTLGILGPTGSGKSTLLRCLSRLHNPPRGTVFLDGVDVLEVDLDDWRQQLGFVPQRAFLFSESLRDNVLMGVGDPEDLEGALDAAALAQDVAALPQGVHSQVGESGIMLSGGQRQRAALARVLLKDHVVLFLDDVLSAVDHATEHELVQTLRGVGVAPTTVIVSHRISALLHAHKVAVLEGGRVVDSGTHEELIERPGIYRDTWERQREGEEESK